MVSIRTTLEGRFGLPFAELMQRFADIGFSRSDTAAVLNVSLANLQKTLQRHGDPFPAQSMTVRYRQETGGSLLASAAYLAQTHSRAATARQVGVSEAGLRSYLELRGAKLTFARRERKEWRQHRATGQPRRTSPTWQTYEAFGVRGSLRELTERFGKVPLSTVRHRVHRGNWTMEKALTMSIEEAVRQAREVNKAHMDRLWAPMMERKKSKGP